MHVAAIAVAENSNAPTQLVVGTKESPPFAYKTPDGSWTGISIELWEAVADKVGLTYRYVEMPLAGMLDELESGELDAAVAAISVTADRHERVDFCHPHFTTGLGIATRTDERGSLWGLLRRIVSPRLLSIVALMVTIVAVCGVLFWRLERGVNQQLFGGKRRQGIEMGVWWSTILLLGHKGVVPVSTAGRLVAVSAMLASLIVLSVLTGVITSVLTVQQLDVGIVGPGDLRQARVVTVEDTTAADHLRRQRIAIQTVPTAHAALNEVANGRADAAVYDRPLLLHLVAKGFESQLKVLSTSFNTQDYAIALPLGSPLRQELNTALLRYRSSDAWDDLVYRYLGE